MSTETLAEMQNRWNLLMAATYPAGHRFAGERVYERDPRYASDTMRLGVQIEELKAAAASAPQINADQLRWLDRVQAAKTADGRVPAMDMSPAATRLRSNLQHARIRVMSGESLTTEQIAGTERDLAAQGAVLPAVAAMDVQPTAQQRQQAHESGMTIGTPWHIGQGPTPGQPINTTITPKA